MAEFRVVQRPELAPGRCFICGNQQGAMLDTGLRQRLPWGAVYICLLHCVAALNRATGAKSKAEYDSLVRELIEVRETNEALAAELQRARPIMREVARAAERVEA